MVVESEKKNIEKSAKYVFEFLNDFNNFGKLMPEQISDWKSTQDTCSFNIQGMAELAMRISERVESEKIVYSSESPSPFEFTLTTVLDKTEENKCSSRIIFDANINPMMQMMLQRPLQNFVNMLNDKLSLI